MATGAELAGITPHELARLQKLRGKDPRDLVPVDRMFLRDIAARMAKVMDKGNSTRTERTAVNRLKR